MTKETERIALFLDTATKNLAVEILKGRQYYRVDLGDPKKSLERTHLAIDMALSALQITLKDVQACYCLLGPGSNTGIRLGLTIPRTLYAFDPKLSLYGLGTLELMLTKPIKTWELIDGKFFSSLIVSLIALLLTVPYYITLAFLGNVDHGTVLLGYFGLLCMAACHISIGIFASSLSRTPVTAFFVHFGIGICFQLLFGLLALQLQNSFMAGLFQYLSLEEHFDALARGIFDSRDIVYFCSICAIFLALSKFCISKNRV